ncbi:MAG: fused MFS/spermidine synthase [Planctomycetota bacterium]|nr:fused MFS/spermidine synthase [Planctomycetota bacterium]
MLPFAAAIFLSAFLLFQVQPMLGKSILPWFGGGPSVWTTCLLFFQVLLLAGYLYAHLLSTRLAARSQALLHLVVIGLAALALPVAPGAGWKPADPGSPALYILGLLAAAVGLPYFALSATAPLLQRWASRLEPGRSPYRLYALSNTGSLLALASYPFLVEPLLPLRAQSRIWSVLFVAYGAGCLACYLKVKDLPAEAPAPGDAAGHAPRGKTWLWLGLAALPSALLLASTCQITQEVAPVPFLWVLPLTLYLLSFVICFDREAWYRRAPWGVLLALASALACYALFVGVDLGLAWQVALFSLALFACCMCCHGELARAKPPAGGLTRFYLCVSAGGALGGLFAALLAPRLFPKYLEFHAALGGCAALTLLAWKLDPACPLSRGHRWPWAYLSILLAGLWGILVALALREAGPEVVARSRNFYGVLTVYACTDGDGRAYRALDHGRIRHGTQYLDPDLRRKPTAYFVEDSGVARALLRHPGRELPGGDGALHVGVIGLGAGTLAAYGREGDRFRIYEIDPDVLKMATAYFTYLEDSAARIEYVLGDARVKLEEEREAGQLQEFDVLVVDAFSSDAIPTHLLTREAFELYESHLKPEGVLAIQATNRYVDVRREARRLAEARGWRALWFECKRSRGLGHMPNTWVLASRNPAFLDDPRVGPFARPWRPGDADAPLWTDDRASLLPLLQP